MLLWVPDVTAASEAHFCRGNCSPSYQVRAQGARGDRALIEQLAAEQAAEMQVGPRIQGGV